MTPLSLTLYRALTGAGAAPLRILLRWRQARGKEDPARLGERMGRASRPRPAGAVVWLHAASVGEATSALPLIERLAGERPGMTLLVTTGTVTSAGVMGARLPKGVVHQYLPLDRAPWVRRFLDHWRPGLGLIVESEFWPNLLCECRARGIPMVLVNGRVSPAALRGWRRAPGLIGVLLAGFAACLAGSAEDAERLTALGAASVATPGNLKLAAAPLPADAVQLAALRAALGDRPRWLAASTHAGEEEVVAAAHRALERSLPGLVTLIVPRHPARGAAIERALRAAGFTVSRRAAGQAPPEGGGIYVADTMGELGLFYRVAPVAFLGGSLVPHGGQNLLEPVRLGCAVVHGPHVENFAEIAAALAAAGATERVDDGAALTAAVGRLLGDASLCRQRAVAGSTVAESGGRVLDSILRALDPLLDRAGHARA